MSWTADDEVWENLSVMSDEDVADMLLGCLREADRAFPSHAQEYVAELVKDIRNGERVRLTRAVQ